MTDWLEKRTDIWPVAENTVGVQREAAGTRLMEGRLGNSGEAALVKNPERALKCSGEGKDLS